MQVLTHTYIMQNVWGNTWENDVASLRVFMAISYRIFKLYMIKYLLIYDKIPFDL